MTPKSELIALAEQTAAGIKAVEGACSAAVADMIAAHPREHVINCTEQEWDRQEDAFGQREAFFAALMPTEQAAIDLMNSAFQRLKGLGWREAVYCPKDGSHFDAIEAGSTGIHNTCYLGDWPTGTWLIDGDSPSRPILYRETEAEKARWAEFRARARSEAL